MQLFIDKETEGWRYSWLILGHVAINWEKERWLWPLTQGSFTCTSVFLFWMFWGFFSSFPSLHSFCPFQTSPEELPCLGILPLPQNRTTIAMKPKQVSECQRRNVVSVGKEEGLLYPMILFWEYCCNSRLCCWVGVRNNSLTREFKTKYSRGISFLKQVDSVKCLSLARLLV